MSIKIDVPYTVMNSTPVFVPITVDIINGGISDWLLSLPTGTWRWDMNGTIFEFDNAEDAIAFKLKFEL